MTLPEPTDVIAPREDAPYSAVDFFREMLMGAYIPDVTVQYHSLLLYSEHHEDGPRLWDVYMREDETYVETLNLEAIATVTELQQILDEIVVYDPDDRQEWVRSR